MITWTYDLATLEDPILRLGIHGLGRLLSMEGNDLYPMVKQSDHLKWKLTDTSIEITFNTLEDLNPLLHGMVGSLPDGVIIPPGYPSEPQSKRFYITGMAHSSIASLFSAGPSTPRRTKATKKRLTFDLYTYTDWKTKQEKTATRSVAIHQLDPGRPLTLKEVKGKVSMTAASHPTYAQWNKKAVLLPTQDAFLAAFSCLGYAYTLCNDGYFGLGIDRPTFSEADDNHRMHHGDADRPELSRLYGIDAGYDVAAVALAIHIDLPDVRPYHVLTPTGNRHLNWTADADTFRHAVGAATSILNRRKEQIQISSAPLRIYKKENSKIKVTVLDQVFLNVQIGRPWYADLQDLVTCSEFQNGQARYKSLLSHFTHQMEENHPMERKIRQQMNRLYVIAAHALGHNGKPDYDKAASEVVSARLQTAVTPTLINTALWEIGQLIRCKSDDPRHRSVTIFSNDVLDALAEMMKKNPLHVQSLLILACMTYADKEPTTKSDDPKPKNTYTRREDGSYSKNNT